MNEKLKVAVVTGAARGIGLGIAHKFLADSYSIALIDRAAETLAQTAAALSKQPILAVDDGFDASGVGLPSLRGKA